MSSYICVRLCGGWENFMLASLCHKEENGVMAGNTSMKFRTDCRQAEEGSF